jgi:hypothetical protein
VLSDESGFRDFSVSGDASHDWGDSEGVEENKSEDSFFMSAYHRSGDSADSQQTVRTIYSESSFGTMISLSTVNDIDENEEEEGVGVVVDDVMSGTDVVREGEKEEGGIYLDQVEVQEVRDNSSSDSSSSSGRSSASCPSHKSSDQEEEVKEEEAVSIAQSVDSYCSLQTSKASSEHEI